MKRITLIIAALTIGIMATAQTIGEIELKKSRAYGEKKLKKSPKKVYIAQFRVFYQMLYSDSESSSAGGSYGSTKVSMVVGIDGVKESHLKETTNKIYQNYLSKLKKEGFEIVGSDEAAKTKFYADWERKKGGSLNKAQFGGYVMSTPDNFEYFVKGTKNSGKEKATFTDKTFKISHELGKITVINVNITVPFISDAESQGSEALVRTIGGVSKIVVKPDLRLGNDLLGGTVNNATTSAAYVFTETKIAADCNFTLDIKKPIAINGIFEDKKIKAIATAQQKTVSNMGAISIVCDNNVSSSNMNILTCDGNKYSESVLKASDKFLNETLELFFTYQKGEKPAKK